MSTIKESNMLLRAHVKLPASLMLEAEEFREGWDLARAANVEQLRQRVQAHGWSLVQVADGVLRSGVGDTSELATASAVKLALRHVTERCNAAEVERIELTQYPWFHLARVRVNPYLIQQGASQPMCDDAKPLPSISRQRRISPSALDLEFGCAMPQLKQLLILSKSSGTRPQ